MADNLGIDGLANAVVVGRGGFGTVYRARQPLLNRDVAVKVVAAVLDEAGRARFAREAYAMGTVAGHPNILQVYSADTTAEGRPFILMPFIDGGTLADRLPLPWPQVLVHGVKLCGALETAHRAGVLHRDIKPANVLLSGFGEPLLADFGIARVTGGYETTDGAVSMSLPYAAPELWDRQAPSEASDVYSMAATLFHVLAGRPPFPVAPDAALVGVYLRILHDPVPDLRGEGVPHELCAALESALAKDPAARPASAAEFGRRLQDAQRSLSRESTPLLVAGLAVEDGTATEPATEPAATVTELARPAFTVVEPVHPARTPRPRHRWRMWAAVALVLAIVGGVAAFVSLKPDPGSGTSLPATGTHRADLRKPSGIAIARDGTVYIADADRHQVLRVNRNGVVEIVAGTGVAGDTGDGRQATEATLSFPGGIAIANDGTLFVATSSRVRQIDPNGGMRAVSGFERGATSGGVRTVAVAPDGRLFVAQETRVLLRETNGTVRTVTRSPSPFTKIESLALHPDGWLAVSGTNDDRILRLNLDGTTSVLAGAAAPALAIDGRPATQTRLSGPTGLAFDTRRRLHLAEAGFNRIRRIEKDGTLVTVAGNPEDYSAGFTGDGGPATSATFALLAAPLAFDAASNLFVCDVNNQRVRRVSTAGLVDTFA